MQSLRLTFLVLCAFCGYWFGPIGCAQPGAVRATVDANTAIAVASPQLTAAVEAQVVARVETKLAAAVDQAVKVVQEAGAQTAKDHSLNIGPVAISGSAWPFVAIAIVGAVAAYFWRRKVVAETAKAKSDATTDLLVKHNEDRQIDQTEKESLCLRALNNGVGPQLKAAVDRVTKK